MSRKPVEAVDVLNWPEFEAFAKRLGIDLTVPICGVEIRLIAGGVANVRVDSLPCDTNSPHTDHKSVTTACRRCGVLGHELTLCMNGLCVPCDMLTYGVVHNVKT